MENCKKCQDVKNEWFRMIMNWDFNLKKLKREFDIVFGNKFDKAYKNGKVNYNWEGKCKFCGAKYHIRLSAG